MGCASDFIKLVFEDIEVCSEPCVVLNCQSKHVLGGHFVAMLEDCQHQVSWPGPLTALLNAFGTVHPDHIDACPVERISSLFLSVRNHSSGHS
jgi:hypothetical protein